MYELFALPSGNGTPLCVILISSLGLTDLGSRRQWPAHRKCLGLVPTHLENASIRSSARISSVVTVQVKDFAFSFRELM